MRMGLIKEEKLEELLVAKWADFLDVQKIIGFVVTAVRERAPNFTMIEQERAARNANQITLSRFQIAPQGFILWAEFVVPLEPGKTAIGTSELFLTNDGKISHLQTIGDVYSTPMPGK